jgi:tRNA(Ile)-lysidine synthetase-like protein
MHNKEAELSIAQLPVGRYIVAVSGGVDSMVLLRMLQEQPQLELIVAHLDHGIRTDSWLDRELVENYSMSHNIAFVQETVRLGAGASEERARAIRYGFLERMRKKYNASAIILAHQQDDLLETALVNLLRGTGRRGLNSLQSHPTRIRPLLHISKAQIVTYAKAHGITWREDATNHDLTYLRNRVRHRLLAKSSPAQREQLLNVIVRHKTLNHAIDAELERLAGLYAVHGAERTLLPCYPLIIWPEIVAYEFLQYVLRRRTGSTLQKPLALRALLFIKTARPHKRFELGLGWQLRMSRGWVIVETRGNVVK